MLLPLLLLLGQEAPTLEQALSRYREKTRGDVACRARAEDEEILVCAGRDADRYRVPLVTASAGREAADVRLGYLLSPDAAGFVPCGKGAFLVRCGSVGVGVSIDSTGGARVSERPLAP
ncbi:hypothetical protein [Sphingomonas sp. M1-B02]|uniref:hypothetical protein n=1 Tax=Sphingomonas sp. M1-B02 TaxID=3114300 RepID=UPI002240C99F|nr:hypothetical protein [Sphingomonas sp. S6-11]UZK65600.1 hypothetical protein OKW87_13935 [Sphingomonas sp. S6-11]